MEQIAGSNNWKLTVRAEGNGITILRALTCDASAALPETLLGLPVTALAHHALSPSGRAANGTELLLTCGRTDSDSWDNRELRRLTLPATLTRVGDYAFSNCAGLQELRLHDSVKSWGGSAFMNCRTLDTIILTRLGTEQGESLEYFNSELSRELDVTLLEADGGIGRLIFPAYQEDYEESCPAHHFQYEIRGAGYPYHHLFRRRQLNLRDYDGLWAKYLSTDHEADTALRLAWYRLRYPLELAEQAEAQYRRYLSDHAAEAISWLLPRRDTEDLRFLLTQTQPERSVLSEACSMAREQQAAGALAILLEEQHRRFPVGAAKSFNL